MKKGNTILIALAIIAGILILKKAKGAAASPLELNTDEDIDRGIAPAPADGKGDVDMDGYVTMNDSNLVQQFILGTRIPTTEEFRRADMNGDGRISVADMTAISRYILASGQSGLSI